MWFPRQNNKEYSTLHITLWLDCWEVKRWFSLVAAVKVTGIDSCGWCCLDQIRQWTDGLAGLAGMWHSPTVAWLLPIWTGDRVLPSKVRAALWPQVLDLVGDVFWGCTDTCSRRKKNLSCSGQRQLNTAKCLSSQKTEPACSMSLKQKRTFFSLEYTSWSAWWEPTGTSKLVA